MFSHVCVGIDDFRRSDEFYAALAAELGLERQCFEPDADRAAWTAPDARWPMLVIGRPFDRRLPAPGNGNMVALLAPNRAAIDRCHSRAMAMGGRDEGAPGVRLHDHKDHYGAYFRDPDGNKLCIVSHAAETSTAATHR